MIQMYRMMFTVFIAVLISLGTSSYCWAWETRQVVIVGPVDSANYRSEELNRLILEKWRRHFKFPFYEITAIVAQDKLQRVKGRPVVPDIKALAGIARQYDADIVVTLDISHLRSYSFSSGFWDGETWQETELAVECRTYEAKTNRFDQFQVKRYEKKPLAVDTGPMVLIDDAMDEVLRKILYPVIPLQALECFRLLHTARG